MDLPLVYTILTGVISGASTWGMMRIEMKYLRRDIDAALQRLDRLETRPFLTQKGEFAHERV